MSTPELKPLKKLEKTFKSTDFLAVIILAAGIFILWQNRKVDNDTNTSE